MPRFPDAATFVDVLQHWAHSRPEKVALRFLVDGTVNGPRDEISFAALERRARTISSCLSDGARHESALLLFEPGLAFVEAFFGCLFAGVVAVPAPDELVRHAARFERIRDHSGASVVLSTASIRHAYEALHGKSSTVQWLCTDEIAGEPAREVSRARSDRTAMLQYTSGSTGSPKGVVLSHDNLMCNQRAIEEGLGHRAAVREGLAGDLFVCWVPLFHDLGLIGNILQGIYLGETNTLLSPMNFVRNPARWLEAVSHFRAHTSGGPSFAYDLCLRHVTEEQRDRLDLSSWRTAFIGAEPVSWSTLQSFRSYFAPSGLSPNAVIGSYGLAEHTVFTSAQSRDAPSVPRFVDVEALAQHRVVPRAPNDVRARPIVNCGRTFGDTRVRIVDPETLLPCDEDRVGEVWLSGASVARGYFNDPAATRETFGATLSSDPGHTYVRTGDFGFCKSGELFLTGRLKDVVIVAGRNHYPNDIEETAIASHRAIRPGGCVAFLSAPDDGEGLPPDSGGRLCILVEIRRELVDGAASIFSEIASALRGAVHLEHGLGVHRIALVEPGSLPKTSSGKKARRECRARFEAGQLRVLAADAAFASTSPEGPRPSSTLLPERGTDAARAWLEARLRRALPEGARRLDPQATFAELGLGSVELVEIAGELSRRLGVDLPSTLLYDHPTVSRVVEALAPHLGARARPPPVAAGRSPAAVEPIAIIGMSCRFPGAVATPEAFWDLMRRGVDAVGEVPRARWDIDAYFDPDPHAPGKMTSRRGGFVDGIESFDAAFHELTTGEARAADPQLRMLLETAWEAFERAGMTREALRGSNTGVYVGLCGNEYGPRLMENEADIDAYTALGTVHSAIAGRLSYWLGLEGPNFPVDTACSSSLVALHLACVGLRQRECSMALAAGVNALVSPSGTIYFSRLGALSPDGVCRSFDAAASGYVRGEGCGAVVLKRLADAQRDGDRVLAVIRGSAINQDGRSNGFAAPSGQAQRRVIESALASSGLSPDDVDYVEAHGTGTPVGDTIEAEALGAVFAGPSRGRPLLIGSVKTNIGHLEGAAGMASLIKCVLMLQHAELVPSLHFRSPNPRISWRELALEVVVGARPWPTSARARTVGVSAFGFSGTNAHVVLQAPPPPTLVPRSEADRSAYPILLSARGKDALAAQRRRLAEHLRRHPGADLRSLAYSLATTRSHFTHRWVAVTPSMTALRASLEDEGEMVGPLVFGPRRVDAAGADAPICFLFTGQGAQRVGMGKRLYEEDGDFRRHLDACAGAIAPHLSPLLALVFGDDPSSSRLGETAFAQPALFALEVALARWMLDRGVEPKLLVGHSVGEIAAACVAGVLSLTDAATLVCARARLMQALPSGSMAEVAASEPVVAPLVEPYAQQAAVAAMNGPAHTVISGAHDAISAIVRACEARGLGVKRLDVSHAFHSPMMNAMLPAFREVCAALHFAPPRTPIVSTLTGRRAGDEIATPAYWAEHVTRPVRFADAIRACTESAATTFVELGPRPVLSTLGQACVTEDEDEVVRDTATRRATWVPTLRTGTHDDWTSVLAALATLHVHGYSIRWQDVTGVADRMDLPTYPFQRRRHWVDGARQRTTPKTNPEIGRNEAALFASNDGRYALSGRRLELPGETLHRVLWVGLDHQPYLRDHVVHGHVVVPGAFYVAVALATAADELGVDSVVLRDVVFHRPLIVEDVEEGAIALHVVLSPQGTGVRSLTLSSGNAPPFVQHAAAELHLAPLDPAANGSTRPDVLGPPSPAGQRTSLDVDALYARLAAAGVALGPSWRWTRRIEADRERRVVSTLAAPAAAKSREAPLHPAMIDNVFAAAFARAAFERSATGRDAPAVAATPPAPLLPFSIRELVWRAMPTANLTVLGVESSSDDVSATFDFDLRTQDDASVLAIRGFQARRAPKERFLEMAGASGLSTTFELRWRPVTGLSTDAAREGSPTEASRTRSRWPNARVIVVEERDRRFAEALAAARRDHEAQVVLLESTGEPHDASAEATLASASELLFVTRRTPDGDRDGDRDAASRHARRLLRFVRFVERARARGGAPSVVIFTEGAVCAVEDDVPDPSQAVVWGLARTWRLESPSASLRCIDLPASSSADDAAATLERPIAEWQCAVRDGRAHVPRLAHTSTRNDDAAGAGTTLALTGKSALVTGGTGHLGRVAAEHLVRAHGASHVILVSRSKPSDDARAYIQSMRDMGARVTHLQVDLADGVALREAFAAVDLREPVAAVVHAAGVLDDRLLSNLDEQALSKVLAPKVAGAWNLHELTKDMPVEVFVCFSSLASVLGSPGQANYAAANAFLDAFAVWRRAQGLPGQSVGWGPWSGGGMAEATRPRVLPELDRLHPDAGARHLSQLVLSRAPHRVVAALKTPIEPSPRTELPTPLDDLSRAVVTNAPAWWAELVPLSSEARASAVVRRLQRATANVLGLTDADEVDTSRPLTALGIDSVTATELRASLRDAGIHVPLTALFATPSLRALAAEIDGHFVRPDTPRDGSGGSSSRLTAGQKRLWFLYHLDGRKDRYHIHLEFRARGRFSVDLARATLATIVERHEALRTIFPMRGDEPTRVVLDPFVPAIELLDSSEDGASATTLDSVREDHTRAPFDLAAEPAFRFSVVTLDDETHLVLFTQHHLLTDGPSFGIFAREWGHIYTALANGVPPTLPSPRPYSELAAWERSYLESEAFAVGLESWRARLGSLRALRESATHTRRTQKGDTLPFALSRSQTAALTTLASARGTTRFAVMASLFAASIHRLTGEDDVAVGTAVANRPPGFQDTLGFFTNTVVIRSEIRPDDTFAALLARTSDAVAHALEHAAVPFDAIVRSLAPARREDENPLFRYCIVQEAPLPTVSLPDGLSIEPRMNALDGSVPGTAKFDLTLIFAEDDGRLYGSLEYSTDVYARKAAALVLEELTLLTSRVTRDASTPLDERADAPTTLGAVLEGPRAEPGPDVYALFEHQRRRTPDAVALEDGERSLSYRALEAEAERFARGLVDQGLSPGTTVGLLFDRGAELVIALLGCLRAGCAFAPIATDNPRERIAKMIADGGITWVATSRAHREKLPPSARALTFAPTRAGAALGPVPVDPPDPAYVIFTSGSTGRPKAAAISRRALANYVRWKIETLPPTGGDRFLWKTSVGFDSSIGEVFYCLCAGVPLVIAAPGTERNVEELVDTLARERITIFKAVPSLYRALVSTGRLPTCSDLRLLVAGGEPLSWRLAVELWQATGAALYNFYGPAEAAVSSIAWRFDPVVAGRSASAGAASVPIGTPITNARAYVLDEARTPVVPGTIGELALGGACVGIGYVDAQHEGSARARFVSDPFVEDTGAQLFLTGDRVRLREDGCLEFIGRIDRQVKLHGQRVELAEVEEALRALPTVGDAAVIHHQARGVSRLIAFVESSGTAEALRSSLARHLPPSMIPAHVIVGPLPRLPSGKVHYEHLSDAATRGQPTTDVATATRTPTEEELARIWERTLDLPSVDIDADFFAVGGDSFLAAAAMLETERRFVGRVHLRDLFATPTIRGLGKAIDSRPSEQARRPEGDLRGDVRLPIDIPLPRDGVPTKKEDEGRPRRVLLTGATGFLGAHLLADLLEADLEVYCLVRAGDEGAARKRLEDALSTRQLTPRRRDRVVPVVGTLEERCFGLPHEAFAALAGSVDAIVHNGAWVHHAHAYETLRRTNVAGTREVIRLAASGGAAPVHFVSTMEVFGRNDARGIIADETPPDVPSRQSGYAQSKWVAEEILRLAHRRGLPISIVRPNLVFGHSQTGFVEARAAWPVSMVRACIALRAIPSDVWPRLRLVPVDYVSAAITRIVVKGIANGAAHHVSQPYVLLRDDLLLPLRQRGIELAPISYREWYARFLDLCRTDATHDHAILASVLPHPDDAADLAVTVTTPDGRGPVERSGNHAVPSPAQQIQRSLTYLFASGEL